MPQNDLDPPRLGVCPYCGAALEDWEPTDESAWENTLRFCPNNACDYFRFGRREIAERFKKNFGYRYCWDPVREHAFPLIAWCAGELSYLKGRCPA